jgi:hypothetical protein
VSLSTFLSEATATEAQLALSYLVWPKDAPAPLAVDEWVRRNGAGWLPERRDVPDSHQVGPAPKGSMTRSRAAA